MSVALYEDNEARGISCELIICDNHNKYKKYLNAIMESVGVRERIIYLLRCSVV